MTVSRLVYEERRAGKPDHEEALLIQHAATLGVPVEPMTWKPFTRRRFRPQPGDVVAGSVKFVRAALTALGVTPPAQVPYPKALDHMLHRKVWKVATLGRALESQVPVFIRPAKRWKVFTGFVAETPNPAQVHGVSRREPVWCSEVVRFVSEWRFYVVRGDVRFVGFAKHGGDRSRRPDESLIREAIVALDAPAAYAIDFGVLDTGETALIEMNDGFSVGAYDDVPASVYWDMIATRWMELAAPGYEYWREAGHTWEGT